MPPQERQRRGVVLAGDAFAHRVKGVVCGRTQGRRQPQEQRRQPQDRTPRAARYRAPDYAPLGAARRIWSHARQSVQLDGALGYGVRDQALTRRQQRILLTGLGRRDTREGSHSVYRLHRRRAG